ncbi:MAG: efflux RND transporter periplasmic adaptor subunit [Betaproteobacteria bacterium]|nr:efflux RND transporter periplasmic adaptor subunit [Betaproteobacteria bacterium]
MGFAVLLAAALTAGCKKEEKKAEERPPVEVTVLKLTPRDTPVSFEFVGQTQSTRQVQIVARVSGFLDKRVYTEGSFVKAGQVMFLQDPKPFKAQLDAAKGELAEQQARLQVARDNLARVKPLAARNALSQRELDDATGQFLAASAAVETAKANVEQAQLNLGYTTITTPVSGLSSFAKVQDGQYLSGSGESSVLTYVAQTDPIWVNFSISENDMLQSRQEQAQGLLRMPANEDFEVEVVLADGSVFPKRGRITFANADYNSQTGTFLLRATVPNPGAALRPGQFVRVRILGAIRPNAILVPQQAVLQGAKGHFVVVVDKENKAEIRPVQVGPWHGNNWFITIGLSPGETVVIDGMVHLSPGAPVKIVATKTEAEISTAGAPATAGAGGGVAPTPGAGGTAAVSSAAQPATPLPAKIYFAKGTSSLDADAKATLANVAAYLGAHPDAVIVITGYADKTGQHAKNVVLAKERAKAVRNTLFDQGVKDTQVSMKPPVDVTGGPDDREARRVELSSAPAVATAQTKK